MAPSKAAAAVAPHSKDEQVLCFHMDMLYQAKILDVRPTDEENSWQYKIHYKGWKSTWDDWVPQDRVRKLTPENSELAAQLHNQMKKNFQEHKAPKGAGKGGKGGRTNGSDFGSGRGSEERGASAAVQGGRGGRRGPRDFDLEHEDQFQTRPSIKFSIPDQIKAYLVDDWENVTKNNQLVPLPAAKPVNVILDEYLRHEKPRRQQGSAEVDLLEEVVAGLKEYFETCLGRILLYRFERIQYQEVFEAWRSPKSDLYGKSVGDTYGAEHLCRLFVSLPELIAQTNMDQQSVNRLREELTKLTNWIALNFATYFVREYEVPGAQYIEKARGQ